METNCIVCGSKKVSSICHTQDKEGRLGRSVSWALCTRCTKTQLNPRHLSTTGDLLDFPEKANVIIHGCNTYGRWNSGIAAQMKARYPEAFAADEEALRNGRATLGDFSYAVVSTPNRVTGCVVNLYQQEATLGLDPLTPPPPEGEPSNKNRKLDYEGFYSGITKIQQFFDDPNLVFAFPYLIGCRRAGGDWRIVHNMISTVFEDRWVFFVHPIKEEESQPL